MSLAKRIPRPIADILERRLLLPDTLHATSVVVVGSIEIGSIRGHTYGPSTINTVGTVTSQLGDCLAMSNTGHIRSHPRSGSMPVDPVSPPPSEKAMDDGTSVSLQTYAIEEVPEGYKDRDHDWFTPGRIFKIFAPNDVEIHQKDFVLLDTKNKEGPGLLMRTYDEGQMDAKGYFLRAHVSLQNYLDPNSRETDMRRKIVYMDEYEGQNTAPNAWIELEHTYNIPFAKYKCIDYGILDRASLQDLRHFYIDWLKYHWGIA